MSLVAKLGDTLPIHQFWAALCEYGSTSLGSSNQQEVTKQNIIDYFGLEGTDLTELDTLVALFQASSNRVQFVDTIHRIFMLKEMQTPGYVTGADLLSRISRIP